MSTVPKISLYSLSDLKNTLDDHIPVYLSSSSTPSSAPLLRNQRFTPSDTHTYIRLALGYAAVSIAAVLFYYDYVVKADFFTLRTETTAAVVAYFALNALLTAWIYFGERGLVFVGARKAGSRQLSLSVRSHAPRRKYEPSYRLTAEWTDGKQTGKADVSAPFTRFFAQDGYFVPAEFEAWLRRELHVIAGEQDAVAGTAAAAAAKPTKQVRVTLEEDESDTIVVGTPNKKAEESTPGSKKRSRKKA